MQTININPSLAWKVNAVISLGGGVNIQYAKAELSNAIDFSTVCLGSIPAALIAAACGPGGFTIPGNAARDGAVHVEGNDWSYGFNLGIMFQFSARTRIGLAYRSKVSHDLEGDADFTLPAGLPPAIASSPGSQTGTSKQVFNFRNRSRSVPIHS